MANPKLVKLISVTARNANDKEFVIIRNLTRGGQLTQPIKDEQTIFNPAPDIQWEEKDLIQAEIRGRLQGVKQGRIQNGGVEITITTSPDTSTPGVSL